MTVTFIIKVIEAMEEIHRVEQLQRQVWQESETDIVPAHLMNSAIHNGGVLLGAYVGEDLAGFVFGFPGFYTTPDGPRLKHYSSMLGVQPGYRDLGIGFALKRAQWQLVRHQGIDRITWTYDPLLSRNAWLNITRLGAVCNTYLRNFYGDMRDTLNRGLPSDRFDVDWWVNSHRVNRRLSRRRRNNLTLVHYLSGGAQVVNPAEWDSQGLFHPNPSADPLLSKEQVFLLVEIPADFQALKTADIKLAKEWRLHTRAIFEALFTAGYLVTDFVQSSYLPKRSYYVLVHGDTTL
jgi:predicted GNAT superfamily acetyltransferase